MWGVSALDALCRALNAALQHLKSYFCPRQDRDVSADLGIRLMELNILGYVG